MGERVTGAHSGARLGEGACAYVPNDSLEYLTFMEFPGGVLQH